KTWYLNRPVTFLGRGQDCDIVLLDHSVSRRHLRVDRTGDGFSVTDDGSGNGTWLNGAKVSRDELYDGDRLLVGDTTLVFSTVGLPRRRPVVGGQVTDPGHRPQVKGPTLGDRLPQVPVKWVLAWLATTLVAVAVTVSVVRVIRARRYAQARAVAESWRSQAVEAVNQRQWPQAREALQAAEALDPALLDFSAEYQRLGQAVRDEQVLARARQALSAGDPAEALTQIGQIAADSPYAFDARMLRRRAEAALGSGAPTRAPSPR
ncbi:MAG: FHA domain-containing protein, partial [Myxococcales bacterium]|nr:FHA domain-containing protein [Myxococcales bacterium]